MNVRGLRDSSKRKSVFTYCKKMGFDIVLMQETHSDVETENIWSNEWGNPIFCSHGKTDARGVAILINPKCNIKTKEVSMDLEGRIVMLQVEADENNILIVNIYAPNTDQPQYFLQMAQMINDAKPADFILGGDFNLVIDPSIDSIGRVNNNQKALEALNMFLHEMLCEDVWRIQHPSDRIYTYCKGGKNSFGSRLDMLFVNHGMLNMVKNTKINTSFRSDHANVEMDIEPIGLKRGPGLWKFNNSLLTDPKYAETMNKTIENSLQGMQSRTDDMKWEHLKEVCINETMRYSKQRAKEKNAVFNSLKQQIELLSKTLSDTDGQEMTEKLSKELQDAKHTFEQHVQYIADGARIRSKIKWQMQGEKSTKYFLGLERVKYSNKTMRELITEDNKITRDQKVILMEQHKYYKKLYSSNPRIAFMLQNDSNYHLSDDQKQDVDREFTYSDLVKALKTMTGERTPGVDGLTSQFYKFFFARIGKCLWDAICYCRRLEDPKLFRSARRGVITLLPKKGKNVKYVKNFRPISLLTVDCKMITKMIAMRINEVIDSIIGPQQTGYVPGRYIGVNLRKLIDIMLYLEREEIPALLVCIDFHKCFDSVEMGAIRGAMRYFGFGEYIIGWIDMVYNSFELSVINAGRISPWFSPTRGVHQGCALSGPLFLIVAETLAHLLKNNSKIKGITVGNEHEVVSQYADDTNVFSMYDEDSLREIVKEFDVFYRNTGLKVNYDKSTIYRLGSIRGSNCKLSIETPFNWSNDNVSVLGIIASSHENDLQKCNYDSIIAKVVNIIGTWKARNLTLTGKITVTNSLIASLFVYQMQVLPQITEKLDTKIKKIIENFIWNGRKPKIKYEILTCQKDSGGIKLTDLKLRDMSLKVQWVHRLHDNDTFLTALAYEFIQPKIKNALFWECNNEI